MIDLHTHILPGMDDGAKDVQTALRMLEMAREQGVTGIALTPHFYRDEERPETFFLRRQKAWERLNGELEDREISAPRLVLGAEVTWVPGLNRWEEPERFCIGSSPYLLLELPDAPWHSRMIDEIYDLMARCDVIPMFAHLERYFRSQKTDYLRELMHMGVPVQISAQPMLRTMDRFGLLRKIKGNPNCLLISDCHNDTVRPPNLGPGMAELKKRLAPEQFDRMQANARDIFSRAVGEGEM